MIDKNTLEQILDFVKCPCDVIGTRTGGGMPFNISHTKTFYKRYHGID